MQNQSTYKDALRKQLVGADLKPEVFGKIAEHLRRLPPYQKARQIFVAPALSLHQVRINALLDQKELILPSAGLKRGFVRFRPNVVPFSKLSFALSFKGVEEFGEVLPSSSLGDLSLGLAVVSAEAVDMQGGRLGDGLGFADIALAVLHEFGACLPECPTYAVTAATRIVEELPQDPWDVRLDGVVLPDGIRTFAYPSRQIPRIDWHVLPKKRKKKMQPLWDLFCLKNPLTPDVEASKIDTTEA